jgi:hypothetical protein
VELTSYRNDMNGSLVLDEPPRLPIPQFAKENLELHPSDRISQFSQKWSATYPNLSNISDIILSLGSLASHINKGAIDGHWQKEMVVAFRAHPIAHKLLSMPRFDTSIVVGEDTSGFMIHEVLRLTSLVFIGLIKDRCRVSPTGVAENVSRLSRFLTTNSMDWSLFMDMRLWVLAVGAQADDKRREWYMQEIAWTMKQMGLMDWSDALEVLKEIIWIGEGVNIRTEYLDCRGARCP